MLQDDFVKLFWKALESFDQEERTMFLRFVTGSTRLPVGSQSFKLKPHSRGSSQVHLPLAHTCFFALDLPKYESLQLMQSKLRTAIHSCVAIDGGRLRQ